MVSFLGSRDSRGQGFLGNGGVSTVFGVVSLPGICVSCEASRPRELIALAVCVYALALNIASIVNCLPFVCYPSLGRSGVGRCGHGREGRIYLGGELAAPHGGYSGP